jgi:hypothetical protein
MYAWPPGSHQVGLPVDASVEMSAVVGWDGMG